MERIVICDGDASTAEIASFERDRRAMLRRGLAIGGGVVAASTIPALLRVSNAFAQADTDKQILESAVGLEQVAVFAYDTAVGSGRLSAGIERVAKLFRDQEQEHANGLTRALRDAGGSPPPKPTSVADVDKVLKGLGDARNEREIIEFAIQLEMAAVAAYYEAHRKLADAELLQTGASIMANEGQHLVVLRQAAKQDPVPDAFETGEKA